jgi:hypothetical protein
MRKHPMMAWFRVPGRMPVMAQAAQGRIVVNSCEARWPIEKSETCET